MANSEERLEEREADSWYTRGTQQLRSGAVELAIDSYQRALALARNNRQFTISLADALSAGNHLSEAREALLRLRESDPEDAGINLSLAQLDVKAGDMNEAVHFYQNALYGRWNGNQIDERRREVRLELIRLLLNHNDRSRALSELLILESEVPPGADSSGEIAGFFLRAGDDKNALKYFEGALKSDRRNPELLLGAGEASFRLGEYSRAQRYLQAASDRGEDARGSELLQATRTILSLDPMAPRLGKSDRKERLLKDFDQALNRSSSCIASHASDNHLSELQSLQAEAMQARAQLQKSRSSLDSDDVRTEFEVIYSLEETANKVCGDANGSDLGLVLIGQRHLGSQ